MQPLAEPGLPVLAVTAVGKDMVRDARYLGLACRIAAEMGAHAATFKKYPPKKVGL